MTTQAIFNLLLGLIFTGVIYYLSTLPLPPLVAKLVQVLSVIVGIIVVINFLAILLGVSSPVAI